MNSLLCRLIHMTDQHNKFSNTIRNTLGGAVGNAIEWYDFAIFGFSAPITAQLFVSSSDKDIELIYVYLLFAIGFLSRPLGSFIFGYVGDHFGRAKTLKLTIWFMSIPTMLIGLMPTYSTLGIMTPVIIALLRLLQGVAMGGEFTGSIIYLYEASPTKRHGLFSSFGYVSTTTGILIGSGTVALTHYLFTHSTILAWAWRIPFWLTIFLTLLAYWLRKNLPETIKTKNKLIDKNPIILAFQQNKMAMLKTFCLNLFNALGFYVFFLFIVGYFTQVLHTSEDFALTLNTCCLLLLILMMPLSGFLSDKLSQKTILLIACILLLFVTLPAFHLFSSANLVQTSIMMVIITVFFGFIQGSLPATFVKLFPQQTRASGLSISFNVSNAIFGGTAPALAMWMIKISGGYYLLVSYLIVAMLIFIVTVTTLKSAPPQLEI